MSEVILLALGILTAQSGALGFSAAGLVALLHSAFLLSLFVVFRGLLGWLSPLLARTCFALILTFLVTEIAVYKLTGVHINRFSLSLLAQPDALRQIGVSDWQTILPVVLALSAFALTWHIQKVVTLPWRKVVLFCLMALLGVQSLHAYLIFKRDMTLVQDSRHMVFFKGLHRYHADMIFSPIFGPPPANPFAVSHLRADLSPDASANWPITVQRNVLMIVIDSLRAKDIAANPALAPNLERWGKKGFLSLTQRSVSNCTHFSLHTLFTGDLATNFGAVRRGSHAQGFFAALAQSGYRISTAEASSLDWYDIARSYLPKAERKIAAGTSNEKDDRFVSEITLKTLEEPSQQPWAHLAYFDGPHFRYGRTLLSNGMQETYERNITRVDALVGRLLDELDEKGILEDTLVIVTADHGEQLLEDGTFGHGGSLSDEQTTVPLLILGANAPTDWIFGHRDIMPFVRGELGAAPLRAKKLNDHVLTGCSYDYPASFALLRPDGRSDFRYSDGILSPTPSPGQSTVDAARAKEDALRLIGIINADQ